MIRTKATRGFWTYAGFEVRLKSANSSWLQATSGPGLSQRGRHSVLVAISAPRVVCLSKLNGNRVFDKQPVHPRAFFTESPADATAAWPHCHTLNFTKARTLKHALSPSPGVLSGHRNKARRLRRCHSLEAPPVCSALPHVNTVIGRPHVPVNLLMRRHGSRRVPLPPRGWPTCLHVSYFPPTAGAWWTSWP